MKRLILDGNPLDDQGLGYLCRALVRNKTVEFVSLRRCGLGEIGGAMLLRLMGEKPGLEVECGGGNPFGEEIHKQARMYRRREGGSCGFRCTRARDASRDDYKRM